MMRDYFRFALDSVLCNRRRVLLTVAIIAVGVASLVGIQTAVAVLAGRVAGSFGKLGASLFTIQAKDDAPPITLKQVNAAFRSDIPLPSQKNARSTEYHPLHSAFSIWSLRNKRAQVRCGAAATDPVVRVIACDAQYLVVQGVGVSVGRNFSEREVEERQAVALIGENVRKKLFGSQDGVGEQITCGSGRYRVVGVIDRQGSMFGESLDGALLVPIDGAPVSWCVTVRSSGGGSLSAAAAGAGGRMAAARRLPPGAKPDFEIVQADTTQALFEALRQKLSLVALAIGLVTMLGASIGLMNSLLVSVKERTREIGTRRALGARARDIAGQFLMESVLIGQAGNVAGTVLGLAFGGLTAWALDGRFTVPWAWLIAALLLSLVVSLVSGLLPARRAAALDPVEALRSF
ncbi:MAG: ABC transporter permease [Bacteroidales bacterium]|nr:ABC transporter permease [Bacteroidales bacterium]